MTELWVWNDETEDYQCVTKADPDIIIYDRSGESMFLKGELPFVQITPNPLYDYYWGASEVQKLVFLQELRNNRVTDILDLLSKQVNPPTAFIGFNGISDEKLFALNRAGVQSAMTCLVRRSIGLHLPCHPIYLLKYGK
jgi:hypothetical protein